MSTSPHVSVIITTYNRAAFLVEAIKSVLSQSYRDYELIVADDGSTDDTAQRVAAFGDRVSYLPLAHSARPEVARNQTIAQARGDLIAFLDDDDLWREDKLTRQVAALNASEAGFAYSDGRFLDPDGSVSPPRLLPHQKRNKGVFDNLLAGCFIHPSAVVIRQALLQQLGGFDERFFSQGDYDLWLRAAYTAGAVCIPEPLILIRRYTTGLSWQREAIHYQNAIRVLARLRQTHALTWRQKWRVHHTLSRWHAHLGIELLDADRSGARRHLWQSLRHNPLQRAAWTALLTTL